MMQIFFFEEKVSIYQKYVYKYRLFSCLNFPGAAILNLLLH